MDSDSAIVLLRAARAADPRHLPTQFRYIEWMQVRGAQETLNAEYAPLASHIDPTMRCFAAYALKPTMSFARIAALAAEMERKAEPSGCWVLLAMNTADPRKLLQLSERLTVLYPDFGFGWAARADLLRGLERRDEERRVLEQAVRRPLHPVDVVESRFRLARSYEESGDSARARGIVRSTELAVARDGRPGMRMAWLQYSNGTLLSHDRFRAALRPLEIARQARSWPHEFQSVAGAGGTLLDAGQTLRSIPYFTRAIAIADSVGSASLRLRAYTRRGRAFAKGGRTRDAERDLRHALRVGAVAREIYPIAEAWHNLAHVYESLGRFVEASQAAKQFVDHAALLTWDPLRVVSMRDLGIIQWKAGWHAAANATFARMVATIDELKLHSYWAGEYFERQGDLQRARDYYRRSYAASEDVSLSLTGLVRVYEALGLLDSAETYARAHDRSTLSTPRDVPLLPAIRARRGEFGEAAATLKEWWQRQEAQGNLEGAVVGAIQHADLLLQGGRAGEALATATHAATVAKRMTFHEERIDALRLKGAAELALGNTALAVATLRSADSVARSHPSHNAALRLTRALGEALERSGRIQEAVQAYDRSSHFSDAAGATFELDLDRARYHDRHVAPYEGALRLLMQSSAARAQVEPILSRSQRRKATALAPATRSARSAAAGRPGTLSVAEMRSVLAPDEAMLDYLLVDSLVAVTVVRRDRAATLVLPPTATTVAALARQLRARLLTQHAGLIDVSRSRFDIAVAHRLYGMLIAPLDSLLRGVRRLVIVPDGALHYLPFEALVESLPDGGVNNRWEYVRANYLLDRYAVTYLPSARFLSKSRTHDSISSRTGGRVVLVARDAPGAAGEITAVRSMWSPERTLTLTGAAATEVAVRRAAAANVAILHIASHALVNDNDPLASHIELAPDSVNDGYLHAGEIEATRTGAQLVVLSACETVSGALFNGEGLMGLARAFLAGGAKSVVASLWPIGAQTTDVMAEFHRRLAANEPPAIALRAAKVALRKRAETAHPLYWASFVLVER